MAGFFQLERSEEMHGDAESLKLGMYLAIFA